MKGRLTVFIISTTLVLFSYFFFSFSQAHATTEARDLQNTIIQSRKAILEVMDPPNLILAPAGRVLNTVRKWFVLGIRQSHLDEYNELYLLARENKNYALQELGIAEKFLISGDIGIASEHTERSASYQRLWHLYDSAALEVWSGNIEKAQKIEYEVGKLLASIPGLAGKAAGGELGGTLMGAESMLLNYWLDSRFKDVSAADRNAAKDVIIGKIAKAVSKDVAIKVSATKLAMGFLKLNKLAKTSISAPEDIAKLIAEELLKQNSSDEPDNTKIADPTTQIKTGKQSTQPSSGGTLQLLYKVGCDRRLDGSSSPFISLNWKINENKSVKSQTIYRDGGIVLQVGPSVGPSYFDGTVKTGNAHTYITKVDYADGLIESATAVVGVPANTCGPVATDKAPTESNAPPPIPSPAPTWTSPPSTPSAPTISSPSPTPMPSPTQTSPVTQMEAAPAPTSNAPSKKTIIATVIDQNGAPFNYLIFACEKSDGSNCSIQTYSNGAMALGPYSSGEYRITVQAGAINKPQSDAVVKSVRVDETANGISVNLGTIVLKRWGHIFVYPIDEVGNPRAAYWELEGVFDNDLCDISPLSFIDGLNRDYYCSNGKSFYDYRRARGSLEKHSLPDGQYILKAFDSLYFSTESFYETTIRILQGRDVDLGTVVLKKQ